jgi:L-seryl-tRNA(Ser) seleniumtransferase
MVIRAVRDLPSVDQILRKLNPVDGLPPEIIADEVRAVLADKRASLQNGEAVDNTSIEREVRERLESLSNLRLRRVINATGVILHTNLGRAPLPYFEPVRGYSNLEYDLASGERGKRDDQIAPLINCLIRKPAIVVNNNAAAVYLVLNELANGGEVIVSRGELIEIGDGFRIPDIMIRSGAILREVGTTNRTRIEDYRSAITDNTRLILRVHPSNFRISGFTSRPALSSLVSLGREKGLPVYEDLGSGCLLDLTETGIDEPVVQDSLAAGVNLASFSCDKLLGGPQAGIIAGDSELVQRVRRNPMYRAFRVDKLILQSLQTTLQHILRKDWRQIPVYRMIFTSLDEIRARAERVQSRLQPVRSELRQTESLIGGGSTPDQSLPTWVIEVSGPDVVESERRLRSASIPVIARIDRGKLVLDMRTVADEEESMLVDSVMAAFS